MYAHPDEVESQAVDQLISVAESPLPVSCSDTAHTALFVKQLIS